MKKTQRLVYIKFEAINQYEKLNGCALCVFQCLLLTLCRRNTRNTSTRGHADRMFAVPIK